MRLLIATTLLAIPVLGFGEPAVARDAGGSCLSQRPLPECRVFLLTNIGAYGTLRRVHVTPIRVVADWGVMVNARPRDAFGLSWMLAVGPMVNGGNGHELASGPAVHYRRWIGRRQSLEVALGTVVLSERLDPGGVLGLVKYHPTDWLGIAVRPEMVRPHYYVGPALVPRLDAGFEIGGGGGLGLSLGAGAIVAIGFIVLVSAMG